MKRFLYLSLLILFSTALAVNQQSFIQFIQNKQFGQYDTQQSNYIALVTKVYGNQLLLMEKRYENLRIKVIYNAQGLSDHIIIFKNEKYLKGFTFDRINLNGSQQLISDYQLNALDKQQMDVVSAPPVCPSTTASFLLSSYNYSDPFRIVFSSPSLDEIATDAKNAGYNVVTLYDSEATTQNILNYLSCPNVMGYQDSGDGDHTSIETADGILSADDIIQYLPNKLQNKTVELHDCRVASPGAGSIKDAFIKNGNAQAFLGGITALSTLSTDTASACFWHQAMQGKNMETANDFCQKQYDYNPFYGDGTTGYYTSNNNDFLSGVIEKIGRQSWGGLAWGGLPGTNQNIFGGILNINHETDELSAAYAKTSAQKDCESQGGQTCTQQNNAVQFQHCAALYYSGSKPYYGFALTAQIADAQAKLACDDFTKKVCTPIWNGCNVN